jgi:hypothetical protein
MMIYPHDPDPNAVPEALTASAGSSTATPSRDDNPATGTLSGSGRITGYWADRGFIVIVLFNTKEFTAGRNIPSLKKKLPASRSQSKSEYPPLV